MILRLRPIRASCHPGVSTTTVVGQILKMSLSGIDFFSFYSRTGTQWAGKEKIHLRLVCIASSD